MPTLVLDGAQVVRFAEARGTNPDRFRYDEDPGREWAFEAIGFWAFHRHRRAAGGCQRHVVALLDDHQS